MSKQEGTSQYDEYIFSKCGPNIIRLTVEYGLGIHKSILNEEQKHK